MRERTICRKKVASKVPQNLAGSLAPIGLQKFCQNVSGAAATQALPQSASKSGRQPRELSCKMCGVARHGLGACLSCWTTITRTPPRIAGIRGGCCGGLAIGGIFLAALGCLGNAGSMFWRPRRSDPHLVRWGWVPAGFGHATCGCSMAALQRSGRLRVLRRFAPEFD